MDNKKINYLVRESYKNDFIDIKVIAAIQKMLKRSDFKKYLNALKKSEKEKSIIVISPSDNIDKEKLIKIFPNKKIVYKKDASLIAGIKIIDNDVEYELNLKDTLKNIVDHVGKIYD